MTRRALWRLSAPIRWFLSRHKRLGAALQEVFDRVPVLQDVVLAVARGDPVDRYRKWIAAYDSIDEADLAAMRGELARFTNTPPLSLIVPVARASEPLLGALEKSLLAQVYEHWELFFVGEPLEETPARRRGTPSRDPRFRWPNGSTGSPAEAWNAALKSAAGEFAVLVDPGVSLPPHALFLFACAIERHPDAVLIYADEDEVDAEGERSNHYFKPEWNEALFCSQNYLGGLVAFRRSLALAVGGCREELDGDCAWGLFLRMTAGAPPETIVHLPFVLSHRRAGQGAVHPRDETEREWVARAHEGRLALVGRQARVEPVGESSYRTRYALSGEPPPVSVIIPSTGKLELLRPCLEGVLNRTSYPDLEVLLVVNEIQSEVAERRDYLEAAAASPQVRVLFHEDRPFNFSWANNWAVAQAWGELVCFLNDDTEVVDVDWLSMMVSHVLQDRVAAVGAMLYSPNGRIQHAGVLLGVGGLAGHNYKDRRKGICGYHDRALIDQDVSCVTAACMVIRRNVFLSVGGFDETLAVAFNDVDLCLRLREAGWRIVWTPSAELYHRESVSIGRHDVGEREDQWTMAWDLMHRRWREDLISDPYYSPNLSLDPLQLWEPVFPPRISYPWRSALERGAGAETAASSLVRR